MAPHRRRDVLIHDYMGVDIKAVWEITQKDLPSCKKEYPKNSPSNKKHLGGFAYVARMNGPDS